MRAERESEDWRSVLGLPSPSGTIALVGNALVGIALAGFNSIQFFVTRDNDPNTASTPASVSRSNRGSFETPPPKHVYTHVG